MHDIPLFVKFFDVLWPVTHILLEYKNLFIFVSNWFVSEEFLVHAHNVNHFFVAVFHKLDFGFEMTGQAIKDFFLTESVAVQVNIFDVFWPFFYQFH